MMENKPYEEIIGNPAAPYLNSLAAHGALLTRSYAITHPSQPNYVALFSGSTQGLVDDSCPHSFTGPNLAGELIQAHRSFTGYAEDLPSVGYTGCSHGLYARKHAPWVDFPAIPGSASQPFTAFPHSYAALPTVAFVIPNLDHDMHNGTISQGDQWLQRNLAGYASWAGTHNSLLVITWDEDDGSASNHITTIVAGDHVRPGRYGEHVTHYRVLRTLQALYGLPPVGASAATTPITDIWR
jgi:acid phosphatase